jgi:sarcosine oxidase subunit beta
MRMPPTIPPSASAVIIGGGVQGLSLAYHLAASGVADPCLVEMNELGSGSSGRSASIIDYPFAAPGCLPLVRASFDAVMRFRDELDADPGYDPIGMLLFCGEANRSKLEGEHRLLQQAGVDSALLDPVEIDDLTPGLNMEGIAAGLYTPHDGVIDAHSLMMGYAHAARRLGARLHEGVRATGLEIRGGRVSGVRTDQGTIATPCVVNAAGFGARQVGRWAGMALPITCYKRHILVTGPVPGYANPFPFTFELELDWYFRREGPGVLIGMGAQESDEEEPQVDPSVIEAIIEHAIWRAPALARAGMMTSWAGLRPLTPDLAPILGTAPHLEGFFNDCGWGGHGVMNAPAGGMILADLITRGETTLADLRHFSVERFPGWRLAG